MVVYLKKLMLEDVAIIGGLVGVQFVYAGNSVLLAYLMSLGLSPFTIVIYFTLATFIILSPFAFLFQKEPMAGPINLEVHNSSCFNLLWKNNLVQYLFLKGIDLTSPAVATAMPNLAPGLIFIIAWAFSKVKIAGTFLCVIGAITTSVIQSTVSSGDAVMDSVAIYNDIFNKNMMIGCMYLMAAVLVLSSIVVLQATTLGNFPAPMSLCAITSLIGVIITSLVQLFENQDFEWGWPLGGAGICVSFNGWAMKKRGPVLVSMFCPIGTVITVVLSFITIGQAISLGSLAGMFLMFVGLYSVLWAKGKEVYLAGEGELNVNHYWAKEPSTSYTKINKNEVP
ncbi:WAT1-related protein [Hibiscus syriacus]|uniref:WAT1-related protein n=1 Tax=Hibiscus syriacus TaxID=106335 RepID=A0A6A2YB00_HIBSY|nr:WAT1-related protein [Hibiscus syriacus]